MTALEEHIPGSSVGRAFEAKLRGLGLLPGWGFNDGDNVDNYSQ